MCEMLFKQTDTVVGWARMSGLKVTNTCTVRTASHKGHIDAHVCFTTIVMLLTNNVHTHNYKSKCQTLYFPSRVSQHKTQHSIHEFIRTTTPRSNQCGSLCQLAWPLNWHSKTAPPSGHQPRKWLQQVETCLFRIKFFLQVRKHQAGHLSVS